MKRVPDPTEAELVQGLRRREPAAFDEMYRRYHARIHRFLVRLAGQRELADDLVQDTWLAAARNAASLAEDTDLGAWLFTIARNRHKSHRRWALVDWFRREGAAHAPRDPVPTPEAHASANATAAALEEALTELSPTYREVLLLSVIEGLDSGQVATVLDIKPEAVRQRLSRARAELSSRLDKEKPMMRKEGRR